ncbi:MAG TPA: hypothetical protein VH851_03880, partial [Candidatus Binatia bacterium]
MKQTAKRTLFGARVILLVATVLLFLPAALAPAVAASAGAPSNSRAIRSKVLVTGVRSTSSDGYARITVDLSQETKFEVGRL